MRQWMMILRPAALVLLMSTAVSAQSDGRQSWRPVEQEKAYAIKGTTGIELYASIGERGPKIGSQVRTIAYTHFKLTWRRKYVPQPDGSCTLTTAVPKLIITYTLPRPVSALSPDIKARWDRFIDGVRRHERVHGVIIVDMVKEIERVSLGLTAAADPHCTKVRQKLQAKLGGISKAQRKRSADFDRVEMSEGGNVHQLILNLINSE